MEQRARPRHWSYAVSPSPSSLALNTQTAVWVQCNMNRQPITLSAAPHSLQASMLKSHGSHSQRWVINAENQCPITHDD